jgi:hypothetical protein
VVVDYSLRNDQYVVRVFQVWPIGNTGASPCVSNRGPLDYSASEHRNPFVKQWAPANAISFDNGEPMFVSLASNDVVPWKPVPYTDMLKAHYPHFWDAWTLDHVKCIKAWSCSCISTGLICTHFWYGFSKRKNAYICQTAHYTLYPLTLNVVPSAIAGIPEDGTPILVRKSAVGGTTKNNAHDIMLDPHVVALWKLQANKAGPFTPFLDETSEFASWLRVNY